MNGILFDKYEFELCAYRLITWSLPSLMQVLSDEETRQSVVKLDTNWTLLLIKTEVL